MLLDGLAVLGGRLTLANPLHSLLPLLEVLPLRLELLRGIDPPLLRLELLHLVLGSPVLLRTFVETWIAWVLGPVAVDYYNG